jgi:hypothetical protein
MVLQIDLGVDSYAKLQAESQIGSSQAFRYCYEATAGATLFANVEAP